MANDRRSLGTWIKERWEFVASMAANAKDGNARFIALIKQFPTEHEPYIWFASAYRKVSEFDRALKILDQGLSSVTNKAPLLAEKVATLKAAASVPEAIEVALDAIKDHPNATDIYMHLANIYVETAKLPEAVHILERGLASNARDEELRSKLAGIFLDNQAPEFAASHYAALAAQFPEKPSYLTLLGNAYLELEMFDRAMIKYREANKLAEEKEGWIMANIGNLLHNRGFHSEAIDYLQCALKIEPNSEYAHRRLSEAIAANNKQKKEIDDLFAKVDSRIIYPLPDRLRLPQTNDTQN